MLFMNDLLACDTCRKTLVVLFPSWLYRYLAAYRKSLGSCRSTAALDSLTTAARKVRAPCDTFLTIT